MKNFIKNIRISFIITIIFVLILCIIYPLFVWMIGQIVFPREANGSLITNSSGQIVGSELIGQQNSDPKYFHPRPSAAGNGYDASTSGGTNLGPTSQKLRDSIKANIDAYRLENNLDSTIEVPADAVTSSASGLDPEISVQNSMLQAGRIAKNRNIDIVVIENLIKKNTEKRDFGFLGEEGVNVLKLNLDLDKL